MDVIGKTIICTDLKDSRSWKSAYVFLDNIYLLFENDFVFLPVSVWQYILLQECGYWGRKVYKKQWGIQKRRPICHEKDRRVSSETNQANDSGTHNIALHNKVDSISEREPKIKRSKSSEETKYKKFDGEVSTSPKDTVRYERIL